MVRGKKLSPKGPEIDFWSPSNTVSAKQSVACRGEASKPRVIAVPVARSMKKSARSPAVFLPPITRPPVIFWALENAPFGFDVSRMVTCGL